MLSNFTEANLYHTAQSLLSQFFVSHLTTAWNTFTAICKTLDRFSIFECAPLFGYNRNVQEIPQPDDATASLVLSSSSFAPLLLLVSRVATVCAQ